MCSLWLLCSCFFHVSIIWHFIRSNDCLSKYVHHNMYLFYLCAFFWIPPALKISNTNLILTISQWPHFMRLFAALLKFQLSNGTFFKKHWEVTKLQTCWTRALKSCKDVMQCPFWLLKAHFKSKQMQWQTDKTVNYLYLGHCRVNQFHLTIRIKQACTKNLTLALHCSQ